MASQEELDRISRDSGLLAVYLFGSRRDDGLRALAGDEVSGAGSDLDIGVVFQAQDFGWEALARLQVQLEDLFTPLRIDLVPLQRVDSLFQARAIDGHRIAAPDSTAANEYELRVWRMAAESLFIRRQIEEDSFYSTV
ncbi:MAG TPA: nucleotidyltransferase domain-containing protein [Thermoanaerobaculia bacterium]|nr:nucleotidyltransferase domain-containing protein [Thermoanaerobaculia bacterium]